MNKLTSLLILLVLALLSIGRAHAQVTYVYTDPQGTPLAEANASGTITATFDYAPYGSIALGTAPNGPGYTGHVNDPDTGLVYMQARYYDPSVGRFLSTDPAKPTAGNAFNFSRYAYANNNPIINIDPDGRTCQKSDSGGYSCHLDGNRGGFSKGEVRAANKAYTNTVNRLNSHPNATAKVTVNGVSFEAKAGDVVRGLVSATVDTAPASSTERAHTQGGGLFATSNYFLNFTPAITIFENAMTSDRHGGTDHIQTDLERTFAHEGIHTLPRENVMLPLYNSNPKGWGALHQDAYNAAGNELYDGHQ